jgi:general secretion pathway protein L
MSVLNDIPTAFSLWIDLVARMVKTTFERFQSSRRIELVEERDGTFTLRWAHGNAPKPGLTAPAQVEIRDGALSGLSPEWAEELRGSSAQVVLRPSRFLFRPLDLPRRATEFLDGIIRAQLDRLSPWRADEAAYHWIAPPESGGERVTITVVATARALVAPIAEAVAAAGAAIVEISTVPGENAVPITVFVQRTRAAAELGRIRMALLAIFIGSGLSAVASSVGSGFLADYYDGEKQQVEHRLAERRAALRASQSGDGSASELLDRRKQTSPSSVIVLDALSALLPDNTYATELRIEGDKVQIIGVTHDAPSLIQLLERSPHFTHANFFAPTTRNPNDAGERFHVEAEIRPHLEVGP